MTAFRVLISAPACLDSIVNPSDELKALRAMALEIGSNIPHLLEKCNALRYNGGMSDIIKRKQQHIDLILKPESQGFGNAFEKYRLPYRALPELDLTRVSTETKLLGKTLTQPLIIGSMTGGSQHSKTINANLAQAAKETGVALAVGSQRVALEVEEARESFEIVRKIAPSAVVFANMGAIQLNYGRKIDDYRRVVDMIKADGLYLHLNPLQEALQPGGDTNYAGLTEKIVKLVKELDVPVFVKEVGHGLDAVTTKILVEAGVAGLDVAGVGGTSWAWVEAERAGKPKLGEWFKDFGWPTDEAIIRLEKIKQKSVLVASGGVRSPLDGLKAHLLGADYYSMAEPFLRPAMESAESVINLINDWQRGLQIGMFVIGAKDWQATSKNKLLGSI